MRANRVVMAPPALDDNLSLIQRAEDLAVEEFVAQARIEALDVAVLPMAPRLCNDNYRERSASTGMTG